MTGELLSVSQAARQLGVARSTVSNLIERGRLSEFRSTLDRRTRFVPRSEVEQLQASAVVLMSERQSEQPAAA